MGPTFVLTHVCFTYPAPQVYDGELTIGTDTALHRIVEAIDAVWLDWRERL